MPNTKTIENWGFNNIVLECDEYDEVNLIYRKPCHKYYSPNNEVPFPSNLIKAQVKKIIIGLVVIKKNNFSDHVKNCFLCEWFKSTFILHAVKCYIF